MTIQAKYNIGDSLWFLHKDRIAASHICGFQVAVDSKQEPRIVYFLGEVSLGILKEESKLFLTKQDLIKSL